MGLPARTTFRALGGVREDAMRVTDPRKEVGMATWNEVQWQVAGLNRTGDLVTLTVDSDGTRLAGAEGWNDLDAISKRVTITHDTTGQYQISCDATYPDWSDTERPVEFHGAWITPIGSTSVRPPTFTLDNATQITVYTWNASGSATDMAFSLKIW